MSASAHIPTGRELVSTHFPRALTEGNWTIHAISSRELDPAREPHPDSGCTKELVFFKPQTACHPRSDYFSPQIGGG